MKKKIKNPVVKIMENSFLNLPTPSSINYMWNWGSLLGIILALQILSGIFLSTHFNPSTEEAFNSIILISRNIDMGFFMRFIHMNMASLFFCAIFIHIARNMIFSSYLLNLTWMTGVTMLLILMMTAFLGYVLPWGQMSFWGATVITNLLSAIPLIGNLLVQWLWGGFSINNSTLNRFFSLHFLMPFILLGLLLLHLVFLHTTGSNNPLSTNPNTDKIYFQPFFISKDLISLMILLMIMTTMSSMEPILLSDPENFNPANPMNTPLHIQPEWYFLFAYAILRSIPNKLGGVVALVLSIMALYLLTLSKKMKNSKKFLPMSKNVFFLFSSTFIILTFMGAKPIEEPFMLISKLFSFLYFFFLLMMCFFTFVLKTKKSYS